MSVAAVAAVAGKAGGTGLFLVGVPGIIYLTQDYTLLYQAERDVIDGKLTLTLKDESTTSTTTVEAKEGNTLKWSCTVKANLISEPESTNKPSDDVKAHLKKYLEKHLTEANTTKEVKDSSRKKLVWDCSEQRTNKNSSPITTELEITVVKRTSDNKFFASLFGQSTEITLS